MADEVEVEVEVDEGDVTLLVDLLTEIKQGLDTLSPAPWNGSTDMTGMVAEFLAEISQTKDPLSLVWCLDPEFPEHMTVVSVTGNGPLSPRNAGTVAFMRNFVPYLLSGVIDVFSAAEVARKAGVTTMPIDLMQLLMHQRVAEYVDFMEEHLDFEDGTEEDLDDEDAPEEER